MTRFKIKIKGKDEKYIVKSKLKGDNEVFVSTIADFLIRYTIDTGMSEDMFFKNIKEHYKMIKEENKESEEK